MSWNEFFPEFAVPKSVERLVKGGVLVDTTLCHDASPNFDATLADGDVVTLWVEHPNPDKRNGQMDRYGLTIQHRPGRESEPILETNDLGEIMKELKEILETRGGPRWTE